MEIVEPPIIAEVLVVLRSPAVVDPPILFIVVLVGAWFPVAEDPFACPPDEERGDDPTSGTESLAGDALFSNFLESGGGACCSREICRDIRLVVAEPT